MKIIELFEDTEQYTVDEVVKLIKRDCKIFLDTKPEGFLYRGMKNKPSQPYKQMVRDDRKPRNMKPEVHAAIDKWFDETFGFKARSNGVFVTGEFDDARSYGTPYAVFPIGAFPFVWSTYVGDLFHLMHNKRPDEVAEELEGYGYQDSNMAEAIESGHEIMVGCKSYYAVPLISRREAKWFMDKLTESE